MTTWMIYGATGYTGELMAEEALRRGHRPLLAGRSKDKLKKLASRLGLDYVAFGMESTEAALAGLKQVEGLELVLHCAGPFTFTARPMLEACLQLGIHYLDITGEMKVFEYVFAQVRRAKAAGIAVMPGAGFDIVPSDCLGKYVAQQVPNATELVIALDMAGSSNRLGISAGTLKSALEMVPNGSYSRRNGELVSAGFAAEVRSFQMPNGRRMTMSANWGDIMTAYRTTGIPNISTYLGFRPGMINLVRRSGWLFRWLVKVGLLRRLLAWLIDKYIDGPSEHARETGRCYIYAKATAPDGNCAEAWLETAEAYKFTAQAGVRCVERVLDGNFSGALTPAAAFGADFVLEIEGVTRFERLDAGE